MLPALTQSLHVATLSGVSSPCDIQNRATCNTIDFGRPECVRAMMRDFFPLHLYLCFIIYLSLCFHLFIFVTEANLMKLLYYTWSHLGAPVTSLRVPKDTRCKAHPLCVNTGVPFWTCEKTHTLRSRWPASSPQYSMTSRSLLRWDRVYIYKSDHQLAVLRETRIYILIRNVCLYSIKHK